MTPSPQARMKIESITAHRLNVPLVTPYRLAFERLREITGTPLDPSRCVAIERRETLLAELCRA